VPDDGAVVPVATEAVWSGVSAVVIDTEAEVEALDPARGR
jgi:hypothetical protein